MEPVKGGVLASLPEDASRLLQQLNPEASPASYAIRFAQMLPEVEIVLSGMNTMEQLLDNLVDRQPLDPREMETLREAAQRICSTMAISCTACGYCLANCPKNICIPSYFKLYNDYRRSPEDDWKIEPAYGRLALNHGRAGDCIGCRSCEQHCPQKLTITDYLVRVKETFDRQC